MAIYLFIDWFSKAELWKLSQNVYSKKNCLMGTMVYLNILYMLWGGTLKSRRSQGLQRILNSSESCVWRGLGSIQKEVTFRPILDDWWDAIQVKEQGQIGMDQKEGTDWHGPNPKKVLRTWRAERDSKRLELRGQNGKPWWRRLAR
jgi:hypothetical protein